MKQFYFVVATVEGNRVVLGTFSVSEARAAGELLRFWRKGGLAQKCWVELMTIETLETIDEFVPNDESDVCSTEHRE